MTAKSLAETEIGDAVKNMHERAWEQMTLVEELGMRDGSCDMLYYDDKHVIAFELKRTLNLKVIAQAIRWLDIATCVFIATTTFLKPDAKRILEALGVGYIFVRGDKTAYIQLKPQILVADMDVWNKELQLVDKQEVAAGSKSGARSTTFTRFVARAKKFVETHPDATLRMIAMQVPHHYSSVQSCMGAMKRYAHYGIVEKFWKDPEENIVAPKEPPCFGYLVQKISTGMYASDHCGTVQFGKFNQASTTIFHSKQDATMCIERMAKRQGYGKEELKIVKIGAVDGIETTATLPAVPRT